MGLPNFPVCSNVRPRQFLRGKIRIILSSPTPWGKPARMALMTYGIRHVAFPLGVPVPDHSTNHMLWVPADGPDEVARVVVHPAQHVDVDVGQPCLENRIPENAFRAFVARLVGVSRLP